MKNPSAYPLQWPPGWPKTAPGKRERGQFKSDGHGSVKRRMARGRAREGMVNTADVKLDEVAIQQMIWKNNRLLSACLSIARHSVDRLSLWPDEICFDFPIAPADKNLIGIAWRLCISKLKIIEKTGSFRSSKAEASNGRVIFQYRSTNKSLARAFMERYGKQGQLAAPQLEMAL